MGNETEIVNAIIETADIDDGGRGLLTASLTLNYGNCTVQGFGGYALYLPKNYKKHAASPNYAGHFIWRCMQIAGVSRWKDLAGKAIRVKKPSGFGGAIIAIGHITKDDWFNPAEDFDALKERGQ